MAVDMEQVRAALEPEEPDYPGAAKKLGTDALPHLEKIITGDNLSLAAKAAYLAGLIGTDKCLPAMEKAARSSQPVIRIAAAAAARHLPDDYNDSLLLQLIDDADFGVRKVAIQSAPASMSEALRSRVEAHAKEAARAPAVKGAPAKAAKAPSAKGATKKKSPGRKKG